MRNVRPEYPLNCLVFPNLATLTPVDSITQRILCHTHRERVVNDSAIDQSPFAGNTTSSPSITSDFLFALSRINKKWISLRPMLVMRIAVVLSFSFDGPGHEVQFATPFDQIEMGRT